MRKALVVAVVALTVAGGCRKHEKKVAGDQGSGYSTPGSRGAQQKPSGKAEQPKSGTEVGAMMPAYSTALLEGGTFDIANERGKVVLLNAWATWCGPCRFEIPELQKLHDQYKGQGFEVVGVSLDEGAPDEVKKFVADQKMTYVVGLDPDQKLGNVLQTDVLPTSVLVDRKGKIVWKHWGLIETGDEKLKAALEAALKS